MEKEKTSIRGKIARNSVRFIMHLSKMKGDNGLLLGAKTAKKMSLWKPPKEYTIRKHNVDGVNVEMLFYDKGDKDKVILQFHGGAYFIGFNDLYRRIAYKYSKLSGGACVASVDYRTAPAYTFPAALEDALKAWNWLLEYGYKEDNIIVVGDSAGGNLALALTMKLRDDKRKLPKGLVLMSPWADMACEGNSYMYNVYRDPMFGMKKHDKEPNVKKASLLWSYAGTTDLKNKYLSPVYGEFNDFPSMLIQVGSYEVLESDAMCIYEKAKKTNVDAQITIYPGMFHVFQLAGNLIPESKQAWKEVETFLQFHFN